MYYLYSIKSYYLLSVCPIIYASLSIYIPGWNTFVTFFKAYSEVYLEPSQTSAIELFQKINSCI